MEHLIAIQSSKTSLRDTRRVSLHPSVLKSLKLATGDSVLLSSFSSSTHPSSVADTTKSDDLIENFSKLDVSQKEREPRRSIGVVWPSYDLQENQIELSPHLFENLGNLIKITSISAKTSFRTAGAVELSISGSVGVPLNNFIRIRAKEMIYNAKYVYVGMLVTIRVQETTAQFIVTSIRVDEKSEIRKAQISDTVSIHGIYEFTISTKLQWNTSSNPNTNGVITRTASTFTSTKSPPSLPNETVTTTPIAGLDTQIQAINELLILPLTRPELYTHFNLTPPRGIILYGPSGVGKTLLASTLARRSGANVLTLDSTGIAGTYHGETEASIRNLFKEAKAKAPAIILVDDLDALVPKREDGGEVDRRVVATLCAEFDGLSSGSSDTDGGHDSKDTTSPVTGGIILLATTSRINDIDPSLRRPGRFDREIEIGIPDASARFEILKVLLEKTPHNLKFEELEEFASRLHGFVGADVTALVRTAGLASIQRNLGSVDTTTTALKEFDLRGNGDSSHDHNGEVYQTWKLTSEDFTQALLLTRPSAMREIFIETPKVRWSEIGGQSSNKNKLKQVVEWPLKFPETFKRLGVKQPKGVLLFGPPGCSKTLIARAMACEAGVNFLSVKGPELFSKYVGDSEKAIRETFRKARAASPSIIFLDEVDAIASARGTDGEGGHSTGDRVLTSLLTEMDGIEELNGVTVLAATNRPEILDSAILRPGRLDRILYVGPPNREARIEIVQIEMRKMSVEEEVNVEILADMTEGCTGAEITSATQQAAFYAMEEDMNIPFIRQEHFVRAFKDTKPRITKETIQFYESWRDKIGTKTL